MTVGVGLDRLLADLESDPSLLRDRKFGLLCHQASVDRTFTPAHIALSDRGFSPTRLFGPEHGFYGVEQDMIAAAAQRDPLTGCEIVSLYQDDEHSLVPRTAAFEGLDLLVMDLQDIGARYYTFAATAIWAAEVAIAQGCEVWVLDRPNPLGGDEIEGNFVEDAMESFVSAFSIPVRHGMTLAELLCFELERRGTGTKALRVFAVGDWDERQPMRLDAPFVAPSPNMPTVTTAVLYPGLCLIEGTELSEGRGTTRPFQLVGAPFVDPKPLVTELVDRAAVWEIDGVAFMPSFFRPQFQKHSGEICAGVELVVTDREVLRPLALGVLLLQVFHDLWPNEFEWRTRAYEFVVDRPAIDLLAGTSQLRTLIDRGDDAGLREWVASWSRCQAQFKEERQPALLYGAPGR